MWMTGVDKSILQGGTIVSEHNKPNYVYIWRVFDFRTMEKETSDTNIDLYLYIAFCKGGQGSIEPAKKGKIHTNLRVQNRARELVWNGLRKLLYNNELTREWDAWSYNTGYELFEGTFYEKITNPPAGIPEYFPKEHLKDLMPGFVQDNVVFEVVRTDNIRLKYNSSKEYEHFAAVKNDLYKHLKITGYYWKYYGVALENLVNDWIDERLTAKDLDSFMTRTALTIPGIDSRHFERQTVINAYKRDEFRLVHRTPRVSECKGYGVQEIYKGCNGDRYLNYGTKKDIGRWLLNKVLGKDNKEIERRMEFDIAITRPSDDIVSFLKAKGVEFKGTIGSTDEMKYLPHFMHFEDKVPLPYEALERFRQTGYIFDYPEQIIKPLLMKYGERRLLNIANLLYHSEKYNDSFVIEELNLIYEKN